MSMPKTSIIVPSYNHARFLRRRINTILAQTFQDFELILLDDCSTDNSQSILREYASDRRVRLELNRSNSGSPFKQWNKGVRLARGKYVWIAESDDYADKHLLERLVSLLDGDPSLVFAYCRSCQVTDDDRVGGFADLDLTCLPQGRWGTDFCVDGLEECRNYFALTNPVQNASAVVFRRAFYDKVGGADESFRVCGDWKLWATMAFMGRIAYVGEPLNYFRYHHASVRSQMGLSRADLLECLRVIRWVVDQTKPEQDVVEKVCQRWAAAWVPAVMSAHVPIRAKREILRIVRAMDPHPIRRAIRPALDTIRLKILRHLRSIGRATISAKARLTKRIDMHDPGS